jgi:hypothetical protein
MVDCEVAQPGRSTADDFIRGMLHTQADFYTVLSFIDFHIYTSVTELLEDYIYTHINYFLFIRKCLIDSIWSIYIVNPAVI